MAVLDRVQFRPRRDEMHPGFHDTAAHASGVPGGLGQGITATGLRLMHHVFSNSDGISNKKSGSQLFEATQEIS